MLKAFLAVILFTFTNVSFSQDYHCTSWSKRQGVSCIFAGNSASFWARQCENPCGWRNFGPHCDIERLCLDENPNRLAESCSAWKKERGVTCQNPATGDWEQKWVRGCQIGLATTWCSDENPNFL